MAKKKVKQPIKVLHAPLNFANQALVLSRALQARGLSSTLLRYQFEANTALGYYDADDRVAEISRRDWFGDMLRNVQTIAAEGYDIVHFWNRTLLWRRPGDVFNAMDLPFIRLAGPRIAYRFTGYDLRRKSLELELNPYSPYRYGYESAFSEDDQQRYLASIGAYVDQFIVQDPEMQSYCPQARIIPRALDLAGFPGGEPTANPRPLVVHAPSRRALKGTEFVLKAVEQLGDEGLDFDFQLIENMPNREALEHYRRADVVVDQLLVGWYGVLSLEAMALGKTVIAYIRPDLTGFFGGARPLLDANPDTICDVLRSAIRDKELREETGRQGRAFVAEVHDSRAVARTAAKLYKKMLAAKPRTRTPDFSYGLGRSAEFVQLLVGGELEKKHRVRLVQLQREAVALKTAQAAQEAANAGLQEELGALKAERATQSAELDKELVSLKAERTALTVRVADLQEERARARALGQELVVIPELQALRHDARRYNELKQQLPALRYKSQRYEELRDVVAGLRAKVNRFEGLVARPWGKWALFLLGFRLPKARRKTRPARAAGNSGGTGAAAGGEPEGGTDGSPPSAGGPVVSLPEARRRQKAGPAAKGLVCIVTRKRINNITRAPRMAQALVDAGWDVVVVASGLPVLELQEACPRVEYVAVTPWPSTLDRRQRWHERRGKQNNERSKRARARQAAIEKGGLRALLLRSGGAQKAILRPCGRAFWQVFVAAPSALLLKTRKENFAATWHNLAGEDINGLVMRFIMVSKQWALTHAFADEVAKATEGRRFDAVQAYDNYGLAAAAQVAARDGAKLIYDAVELTTHRLGLDLSPLERVRERLERREEARIVRRADGMIAVGDALADWYARHFRRPRPVVVRNCRFHWQYRPDSRLREDAGVGPDVRLLVWCGAGYPDQGIEFLIKVLPHLPDRVHAAIVAFYQPLWAEYGQQLLPGLARELGVAGRVHFLPAREPNDLVPYISGADIGVIPSWGAEINNLISLPNKFHEMVMARLPLASSRRGEVVDMIKRHAIGDMVDEQDLAKTGKIITAMLEPETYATYKKNVMNLAEDLTWEKESRSYIEFFERLVRRPAAARAAVNAPRAAAE